MTVVRIVLEVKIKENIMWAIHNLVAHPLSEVFYWTSFVVPFTKDLSNWIHDVTVPNHHYGNGRG